MSDRLPFLRGGEEVSSGERGFDVASPPDTRLIKARMPERTHLSLLRECNLGLEGAAGGKLMEVKAIFARVAVACCEGRLRFRPFLRFHF